MDSSDAATVTSTRESDIGRLRGLLKQQRFSEALVASQRFLATAADHQGGALRDGLRRDGLLCLAVAQRGVGRVADALKTLDHAQVLYPNFSRFHEERGNCFVALKQAAEAIDAFLIAVNINHALPSSWGMLEGLYRMTGQAPNAAMASSHVATLRKLPMEIVLATSLFMDGDLEAAETRIRAYLLQHGDQVEAMRLLARIGIARKVFDDAQILLAAVLELAPTYRVARREYAEVLLELHHYAHARQELQRLLEDEPDNRTFRVLLGTACIGLGEHEKAIELYRSLLRSVPEDADLHLSIAHAHKTLGRRNEAIDSYRSAAACRPNFGDAYWSLANLKTYRFTEAELTLIRAAESAETTGAVDRYHLSFALGKAYEDRGDFAESWRHYQAGNDLKRAESNYRPEIIEENTRRQIAICSSEFFAGRRDVGAPHRDPIFIVGLPRSGSTLLEQILASHSLVEGTQELANVQQIVHVLRGREPELQDARYPQLLTEFDADQFRELGERYLAETRIYRTAGLPYFIDKMPNNFRHLGLIHSMLPNARIIDARREPLACCVSNLKQLFAKGQEFTYSMEDIARYYLTYLELMAHWDDVLPGRILRVFHEDVVEDLPGSVRRLLDFCGLEFEATCLEFHKTTRSVRTASSEQVRQPLYREGLDQWKHFEPWLQPLKDLLGDATERYRDR